MAGYGHDMKAIQERLAADIDGLWIWSEYGDDMEVTLGGYGSGMEATWARHARDMEAMWRRYGSAMRRILAGICKGYEWGCARYVGEIW